MLPTLQVIRFKVREWNFAHSRAGHRDLLQSPVPCGMCPVPFPKHSTKADEGKIKDIFFLSLLSELRGPHRQPQLSPTQICCLY